MSNSRQPEASTAFRFRLRRALGWLGVLMALPFFLWVLFGLVPGVPDMIEVFGISGLRTPAAITITGLLLAAAGFHEP